MRRLAIVTKTLRGVPRHTKTQIMSPNFLLWACFLQGIIFCSNDSHIRLSRSLLERRCNEGYFTTEFVRYPCSDMVSNFLCGANQSRYECSVGSRTNSLCRQEPMYHHQCYKLRFDHPNSEPFPSTPYLCQTRQSGIVYRKPSRGICHHYRPD